MSSSFLDSNIFLRHFIQDIPEQSKTASEIFASIEKGQVKCIASVLVIGEVVWIMERYYHITREVFIPQVINVLSLSGINILEVKKEKLLKMLDYMQKTKFDFTDIYLFHIAGSKEIISFDKDFKKIKSA